MGTDTDPLKADTDDDGVNDGDELAGNSDPLNNCDPDAIVGGCNTVNPCAVDPMSEICDFDGDGLVNSEDPDDDGDDILDVDEDVNGNGDFADDDSDGDGIPDIIDPDYNVFVHAKVFLQGAHDRSTGLMRDDLRVKNLIPTKEPFTDLEIGGVKPFTHVGSGGGETVQETILDIEGDDAIVDWIFLEVRAADNVDVVEQTRAALIQRDGDIVDTDGVSPVAFPVVEGRYHVVIKHRNHLGIMSGEAVSLRRDVTNPATFDFTSDVTKTWGVAAQREVDGVRTLWGGNTDGNRFIIFQGSGVGIPDTDGIFFTIFLDTANNPPIYNHITQGYYLSDTNMDGEVLYQGLNNDIDDLIFFNILSHPQNPSFFTNFFIEEQVPSGK